MNKVVLGIHLSRTGSIPMAFLNSFRLNIRNDTKLVLFTNMDFAHPLQQTEQLELIRIKELDGRIYKYFKLMKSKNSSSRLYRAILKIHRIASILFLNFGIPVPNQLMTFILSHYPANFSRFIIWCNYVIKNKHDQYFFTDVSDVIFQSTPFQGLNSKKIIAFEERSDMKIKDEIYNKAWIDKLYFDRPELNEVLNQTICCCGTILSSDHYGVVKFLKAMSIEILGERMSGSISGDLGTKNEFSIVNGLHPAEQGIFNWMACNNHESFSRSPNGEIVYTIGTEPRTEIEIVGCRIRKIGSIQYPSVVHQYNRHADLNEMVERCYNSEA